MPSTFSIASVIIPEPNIPVRDLKGVADCRSANFTVWRSALPSSATPVSIAIGSEKTTIDVTFHGPIPSGETFTLSGKFLGQFPEETTTESNLTIGDAEFDSTYAKVSVTVTGFNADIPWGVRDTIEWRVNGETPTETPIELYAITPYKFIPVYFQGEVPLEFLRLFLLPILPLKLKNHAEFINYAVVICFKSEGDKEGEVAKGHPNIPTVHSYKYNHLNAGSASFTGQIGHSFALSKWLDNRGTSSNRNIQTVNCYDQAGIVTLVVALGLPSRDAKLFWYWMKPYGYINGDLVGVGKCNNPYFGEAPQLDNTQADKRPDMTGDLTSPRRSGFREHVFAGIDTGEGVRIMDACAGKHFGTETLEEYITAAIERENIPADPRSAEDIAADPTDPEEGEPDTVEIHDKEIKAAEFLDDVNKQAAEKAGKSQRTQFTRRGKVRHAHYHERLPKKPTPFGIKKLSKSIAPPEYNALSENQKDILNKIDAISTLPGRDEFRYLEDVDLQKMISEITEKLGYKGFGKPNKVLEGKKIHIEWSRNVPGHGVIIVRIIFEPNYTHALSDMNASLLSCPRPEDALDMAGPRDPAIMAHRYLAGPDIIRWIVSHALVTILRASPSLGETSTDLNDIADDIHSVMSDTAKGPKLQVSGGVVIEPKMDTEFPAVDKEFSITITAPNGSEIGAFINPDDNEPRSLLIRNAKVETVENSATIQVVPLSEGTHKIKFTCAHWQTLEVTEKTLDITVGGN